MGNRGFKELIVWQKGKDLAIQVYNVTNQGPLTKDFGLREQMRRSAVSIPSNIAEGDERDTDKEAIRFFYIAKGSLAELRTQLEIAFEINYLEKATFLTLEEKCLELGGMLGKLIKARSRTPKKEKV